MPALLTLLALYCGCGPVPSVSSVTRPAAGPSELELELIPRRLYAGPQFSQRGEFMQVMFHLNLYNRGATPLTLRRVELIFFQGKLRLGQQIHGAAWLARRLRPVPWIVMHDRRTIAAAHRWQGKLRRPKGDANIAAGAGVSLPSLFWIVRPDLLPTSVRVVVTHSGGQTRQQLAVQTHRQQTRLHLPVQGKWWVMAGHRFDEYHGQAFINSQNFALDLGRLGSNLGTSQGDRRSNSSFFCHGQAVVAAADGQVVELHDGVDENNPVGRRPAWRLLLRQPYDIAGNFVVLRHTAQEYTAYLHLRPGLAVKRGAAVRAGEVLGSCGNSGNSGEPHLHFQLQDGPDPLRANGLPVRFSDFTVHLNRLRLYVPPNRSSPLPTWLVLEPGKADGAVDVSRWLRRVN